VSSASLYVEGIGWWSPRLPGWELARSVLRGERPAPSAPGARPIAALLPATERRRAPDAVLVALEVAMGACAMAGREPKTLASVFASSYGDLAVTDYLCETLARTPAQLSPTKFHHSVHNAAAGYWTIATGALTPYTALAAGAHTFGTGLLSSIVQLAAEDTPVLYAAYDVEARGPLATMARSRGLLGVALVLSPKRTAASRARLTWRVLPGAGRPSPPRAENLEHVAGNALEGCLALFEALAEEGRRTLTQSLGPQLLLELHVEPCE
jgi:hypothetical protein